MQAAETAGLKEAAYRAKCEVAVRCKADNDLLSWQEHEQEVVKLMDSFWQLDLQGRQNFHKTAAARNATRLSIAQMEARLIAGGWLTPFAAAHRLAYHQRKDEVVQRPSSVRPEAASTSNAMYLWERDQCAWPTYCLTGQVSCLHHGLTDSLMRRIETRFPACICSLKDSALTAAAFRRLLK